MKKHSISLIVLAMIVVPAPAFAAVADYAGTYSGTYSGTDSGTWTAKLNTEGNGFGFSWSSVFNEPDVGTVTVDASGQFVASMNGGATLSGQVDSEGNVTGTWENPAAGHHGDLSGSRNAERDLRDFAGTYSGTFSGTDNGNWTAQIDDQGNVTGSSWSLLYQQADSGSGILNSFGEFVAAMDGGAILYGVIDSQGNVQGVWYNPRTGDRGTMSGAKQAETEPRIFDNVIDHLRQGGGDDDGGGCFIGVMN